MDCLTRDISLYCNDETIDNIRNNHKKIFGLESNLGLKNEHKKCVGRILLRLNNTKFYLGDLVEFNEIKIKWRSSKENNGFGFYLVDPYWCKKWSHEPLISIPCKIFQPQTKTQGIQMMKMSFKQFMKRRLLEMCGEWKYKEYEAVENFYKMKPQGYWKAINSTVKHYSVESERLKSLIGKRNKFLEMINREWAILSKNYYEQNERLRVLDLMSKKNKPVKPKTNVIRLQKSS